MSKQIVINLIKLADKWHTHANEYWNESFTRAVLSQCVDDIDALIAEFTPPENVESSKEQEPIKFTIEQELAIRELVWGGNIHVNNCICNHHKVISKMLAEAEIIQQPHICNFRPCLNHP